jgi:hypothetical protein
MALSLGPGLLIAAIGLPQPVKVHCLVARSARSLVQCLVQQVGLWVVLSLGELSPDHRRLM